MDVDAGRRLRGALLAAVGVAALGLGGWWWQAQAPEVRTGVGVARYGPSVATYWREDPVIGEMMREFPEATSSLVLDARTGAVVGPGGEPVRPGVPGSVPPERWRAGGAELVWTELARLTPGGAVVRQTRIDHGERHLLRVSCTGPGELLIALSGARSAAPMTAGCDGGLVMMEIIGTGAPARLSFSPAGSQPVQVEARLIALR